MFEVVAFYTFAVLTIAMFTITVVTKNALYALSSLAAGMIFISAFFFLLNADFLGVVQIVVYTGAVMALYAFGMMFFDSISDVEEKIANPKLTFLLTGMVALLIVLILVAPIVSSNVIAAYPIHNEYGNAQDVGLVLFTKFLIPFEVAAVMLLVAMIGGIILAGKKMDTVLAHDMECDMDHHHSDFNKKDAK
ncbi:MAG: NADH-quinone oxidoreductase subunit J [Arcobacteraceae bacterium]|jgi:NADH-quinone oxidoreductase subunit J|nr:NADH-quinone oxidoreductase subunit J [Arcobacteraceae bacterium]